MLPLQQMIYEIRDQRVMLDKDLAKLYGVEVKMLNRAVKRNPERFPEDFMFQLNNQEVIILRCQNGTSSWGGARYLPYAFTEQGVAMLSSVLRSQKAIEVNISIMRAFVAMRQYMVSLPEVKQEIKELKQTLLLHIDNTDARLNQHEQKINQIIQVLNYMQAQPKKEYKIGFDTKKE